MEVLTHEELDLWNKLNNKIALMSHGHCDGPEPE